MRSLKPVSSEVEQIRAQQKDFAELKRRTLEPLGQNVTHCNKIGQGLVRSALQGVSTQVLEKDLEKMNDKWNALKEKVTHFIGLFRQKYNFKALHSKVLCEKFQIKCCFFIKFFLNN